MSWLRNALHKTTRPQQSVIGVLKQHLGGPQLGRSMKVLHASDVTKIDFCPRQWAFFDIFEKDPSTNVLSVAQDITFQMGNITEALLVEEWAGDAVIGNWRCRFCGEQRSMTSKPGGYCGTTGGGIFVNSSRKHWWQHVQVVMDAPEYGVQGGIDALFNIGAPQLVVTEIKTMAPAEFEEIVAPLPEHRLRTNLYLWVLEHSQHPYRDKINLHEARVLYVSRGYGKMNPTWSEILPFKEFTVKRNDLDLSEMLKRAKGLQTFRTQGLMPSGICATAMDKIAKKCSVCKPCFSGNYPAGKYPSAEE